ncbi:MAG: tRNA lysidine(34) synthetase TilS [Planctomycetaceae bacterium]
MFAPPPGRILLAFSGGPDSVGLAAALSRHEPLLAYVDHRLRGPRASREERLVVREVARALGLPLVRVRLAPRSRCSEAAARRARYDALRALARRHGCNALLTAHSADDRAETILLRLLRGTGLRGLAALPPRARVRGVLRVRPAIDERRSVLRAFGAGMPCVEDRSNRSIAYARSRVRGLLLPAIEERLGLDPVPLLCGLGDLAQRIRSVLQSLPPLADPAAAPAPLFPYLVEGMRRDAGCEGPPYSGALYGALRAFLEARDGAARFSAPRGEWWTRGAQGPGLSRSPSPPASPTSLPRIPSGCEETPHRRRPPSAPS